MPIPSSPGGEITSQLDLKFITNFESNAILIEVKKTCLVNPNISSIFRINVLQIYCNFLMLLFLYYRTSL